MTNNKDVIMVNLLLFLRQVKIRINDVNKNNVLMVWSAPSLTLVMIDPISEMASVADKNNINFHVDACVGGFFLPFLEKYWTPKWYSKKNKLNGIMLINNESKFSYHECKKICNKNNIVYSDDYHKPVIMEKKIYEKYYILKNYFN